MKSPKTNKSSTTASKLFDSNTPMDLLGYLIKYALALVIIAPILYFVFGFSSQEPFWAFIIRVLFILVVVDLGFLLWNKRKARRQK